MTVRKCRCGLLRREVGRTVGSPPHVDDAARRHSIIAVERYPQFEGISNTSTQVTVALGWVVLTVFGVLGYRRYRQRRYWPALAFLLVYSLSGLATAGHFLVGVGATGIGQARNQVSTER